MAKLAQPEPVGSGNIPKPPKRAPAQRHWVANPLSHGDSARSVVWPHARLAGRISGPGEPPLTDSVLWKKFKRSILFWRGTEDVVQVSVFRPPTLTSGQPPRFPFTCIRRKPRTAFIRCAAPSTTTR